MWYWEARGEGKEGTGRGALRRCRRESWDAPRDAKGPVGTQQGHGAGGLQHRQHWDWKMQGRQQGCSRDGGDAPAQSSGYGGDAVGDSDGGGYTKECRRDSMDSLSDARKVGRAAAGECRGGCSGGGNTLRGTAGMCPGSPRQGQQREPCAHLWALPASHHPRHGCPARPAAWRPGWTRRGCSPLPRPCGRRPTGCLRTRETGLCAGAAHIGVGEPAPQHCPCSCPVPTQPRVIKCTSSCTCHRVVPSCSGGAEAPKGAATTVPPTPPPPPRQPHWAHAAAAPASARHGDRQPHTCCSMCRLAHASPSWALAQPLLCRHSSVPRYPTTGGHSPTWPQAPPGSFCPMGAAPQDPGHSLFHPALPHGHSPAWSRAQPAPSPSVPKAQPDMPHGHSLPHLRLPHEQSLP